MSRANRDRATTLNGSIGKLAPAPAVIDKGAELVHALEVLIGHAAHEPIGKYDAGDVVVIVARTNDEVRAARSYFDERFHERMRTVEMSATVCGSCSGRGSVLGRPELPCPVCKA